MPDEDPLGRVADVADAEALTGPLRRMLADLPREQRDAPTLVAWGELTPAQVSAALGIGENTVRTRPHRARAKLRAGIGARLDRERTGDV
ncbi:RNA polymerase sigma factor [Actinosynnema mirum]|uniref:RNA polymerase, sigma-24 subunit, ECF subfamily n=1 Tax=Actinosynnema mirum (strain ATCC 29888 / DSM 43827 / JCM 3225 / NBRC 14064 / NCIMB 13271 / NRRL B-12336 / IMRU 3971 / 101) TaxID=446462 RepID=C6WML0_ACTMD|nr:sigma factor-like helix-turn-helix DNA-binding protein [Actinosynnema mirum]ACU36539.1 RNA polymerase, sigma-24 subunit, ECF subfamily [Actinosynnema mirum DSM 43827]